MAPPFLFVRLSVSFNCLLLPRFPFLKLIADFNTNFFVKKRAKNNNTTPICCAFTGLSVYAYSIVLDLKLAGECSTNDHQFMVLGSTYSASYSEYFSFEK